MEISFETQYALQEFREIESDYFCPDDNTAYDTAARSAKNIMERMLDLINKLEAEVIDLQEEINDLKNNQVTS